MSVCVGVGVVVGVSVGDDLSVRNKCRHERTHVSQAATNRRPHARGTSFHHANRSHSQPHDIALHSLGINAHTHTLSLLISACRSLSECLLMPLPMEAQWTLCRSHGHTTLAVSLGAVPLHLLTLNLILNHEVISLA